MAWLPARAIGRDGPAAVPMRHYGTREIASLSQSFTTMAEAAAERWPISTPSRRMFRMS